MKELKIELLKSKIWLDKGLMMAFESWGEFSTILIKGKGFFGKWKIVDGTLSSTELSEIEERITNSINKSHRFLGKKLYGDDKDLVIKKGQLYLYKLMVDTRIKEVDKRK